MITELFKIIRQNGIIFFVVCIFLIFVFYKKKCVNNVEISNRIKQTEKKVINNTQDLNEYYKLVKFYHYGIPERFTLYGYEKAIKPQPIKAIYLYNQLIQNNNLVPKIVKIECMKNLIDIYTNDIPGYNLKNPEKAKLLYKKIYEMSELNGKYEIILEYISFLKGNKTPLNVYGNNITNHGELLKLETLKTKLFKELQIHNAFKTKTKKEKEKESSIPLRNFIRAEFIDNQQIEIVDETVDNVIIRDDKHNVHDTTLLNSIKSSINKLKEKTEIKSSMTSTSNELKALITNSNLSPEKKSKAFRALNEIENKNDNMYIIDDSEKNVLNLVWNRIQGYPEEMSKVLKENLIDEMSEMIEFDKPVCSTGRITRIIDSINGVDTDVVIKPKWALQKEMVDKANFIFQNHVNSNEKIKKVVDEINPTFEEEQEYQKIKSEIKEQIYNSFEQDYIETGIMDKDTVSYELDKWIDAI